MALVLKDRVRETSLTGGTGTLTLNGAVPGFQAFSVIGNTNTTYYAIVDNATGEFEVGLGTYTLSGTTLSRDSILESSSGGSAINFTGNIKDVFCTYPAERSVYVDGSGIVPATASRLGFVNLTQGSALSVLGVTGNATADNASIAAGTDHQVLRRSGTALGFGAVALNQAAAITGTLPVANGGTGITSFGTGVATFLGTPSSANLAAAVTNETGTGALVFATSPTLVTPVLGTPSSGTVTNLTGTASININGTVGATTPATGSFTTLTTSSTVTHSGGTANGVAFLNGSKVLTTGSALTFDGTNILTLFRTTGTEANEPTIRFSNLTFAGQNPGVVKSSNGGLALDIQSPSSSTFTERSRIYMNGGASKAISFQASSNNGSTYSERMVIDSAGNVGIGTSSPVDSGGFGRALDLRGTNGSAYYSASSDNATRAVFASFTGAGYMGTETNHPILFRTNNTERMRIDSAGNVGIGTSSPEAKLHLLGPVAAAGETSPIVNFSDGTRTGQIAITGSAYSYAGVGANELWYYANGALGAVTLGSDGAVPIKFVSNGAERMRIDSSGNLLVGKTSTSVSVSGAVIAASGVGSSIATGNDTFYVYNTTAAAYRFFVTDAGIVFATNTTISAISDQRLKENVYDLDVGLSAVMALKPRKFDWKDGKGKNIKGDRGWIAQEFEQVFPDMIDTWKDAAPEGEEPYKSVRADLIPVLVKAIQEQQAIITALTARITALESN